MSIRKIPQETSVFHFYNANPKNNRTGDCVIRAMSLFLNKSWEEVFTELCEFALEQKLMPDDPKCYKKYLKHLGYDMNKQPRHSTGTKFTGKEFCENFADYNKVYLTHIGGHHIVCIINNRINDIWDSSDGCIGNYWVK